MAYDPRHAAAMRADLAAGRPLAERRMFGGLCFLLDGNMVSCISERGALYRPGAAEVEALALPGVAPMIHGGRRMGGFVWLDLAVFTADAATRTRLSRLSLAHAESLPPKEKR